MIKERLDIIANSLLFKDLPARQLEEIERISVDRRFEKGELIFSEGDDGKGFFLICDGRVKIFKVSAEGKEQILHFFGPGDPFGEVPVFSGKQFPASAEAVTTAHLLFIPRAAFVGLITANPSLALNMLAILSSRLRQFTVQIENLSLKEVPSRLAGYLLYLAEEQGGIDSITLGISKGQLASLLGTIPETLSRIFARMSSENLIEVKGRDIGLLDRPGLKELAEK
jgi:CRP/FNR family transcriptional regulator